MPATCFARLLHAPATFVAFARGLTQRSQSMTDRSMTRMVTIMAAVATVAVALTPPTAMFFATYQRLEGVLETSARLHATEVMVLARQTPAFWRFAGLRVSAPEAANRSLAVPERRRVYDRGGRLVVESVPPKPLAWPVMARRAPIMDGDTQMGEAEAARSFRSPLLLTLLLGFGCALGGLVLFVVLRVVPLHLLHKALDRATYLSAHDVLTGLPNRSLFADRLHQALAAARRDGSQIALLCLDLDHFKEVNDTLGHAAGDLLLRTVSARLRSCLRESDTLARLGGDEFTVIQVGVRPPGDVQVLASRLIAVLEAPINLNGAQASVGVSIGIAIGDRASEPGQLQKDADVALYQAKGTGRGGFCFFEPALNARLLERRAMETDLRAALGRGELCLSYQPQLDGRTGQVIGAEALLHWNRPGHGRISSEGFIGFAEEIGLSAQIGSWVLDEACRAASGWPAPIGVAVNVSPLQFRLAGFHDSLAGALRRSGLVPSRLQIEITESVLLSDTDETLAMLHRLRGLGVRIAMDHFGTGYSSLGYLRKFRFDKIKIDHSFVQHLDDDRNAVAIVRAIAGLSAALGVTANAEGVETSIQADLARVEGCTEMQGGFCGPPLDEAAFSGMVLEQERAADMPRLSIIPSRYAR